MGENLNALNAVAIRAAKQHMHSVAWPTVLLTLCIVGGFSTNLTLFVSGQTPLWAAILVYAVLTYMAYTPLHEAVHGNIHGDHQKLKWLNDLCGYLVAPVMLVPFSSHKIEHMTHHRYTNQPDKDPDYVVSGMRHGFLSLIICGLKELWVQNTFLFRKHWSFISVKERAVYCLEQAFSIGWRIAFVAVVTREGGLALLTVGYLLGAFFVVYWFAYRPHLPYKETARYRNTATMIMPRWMRPLEWFWLGQNLHSIHHLFPRVPFYRYHALYREIEPAMRAHGAPVIGMFNRRPVPPTA